MKLTARNKKKSLDELIDSLPILKDPRDPENRALQAFALPVKFVDGNLHAMYLRKGSYVERPVGFSYDYDGQHRFTLSERFERIPLGRKDLVIPLTVHEQGISVNIDPDGNPIPQRDLHGLGIMVDDKNTLPLLLSDSDYQPIVLLAEPEYNILDYEKGAHR